MPALEVPSALERTYIYIYTRKSGQKSVRKFISVKRALGGRTDMYIYIYIYNYIFIYASPGKETLKSVGTRGRHVYKCVYIHTYRGMIT